MALACAHCGEVDVAALFDTVECFTCGCHSTFDGRRVLPTSLATEPSDPGNVRQYGGPIEEEHVDV